MAEEKETVKFKVEELAPKCDIRDAHAEPGVVKPGATLSIIYDVCNVGGGVMNAEIRKTFTGPTPIPPITENVPGVPAGGCVHHTEAVKIPEGAKGGDYTCTLVCYPGGVVTPVRWTGGAVTPTRWRRL